MRRNFSKTMLLRFVRGWAAAKLFALVLFVANSAHAQDTVTWTTNSYPVTGSTLEEIHQSLRRARASRNTKWDASTEWNINWRFSLTESSGQCRVGSFSTKTTIALTLPRWTAPTNAEPATRDEWRRYITALAQHELGHAQFAQLAAAGVRKVMSAMTTEANCEQLKKQINAGCNTVVENFKKRDQEYDERTRHWETQGASLIVPRPGPR